MNKLSLLSATSLRSALVGIAFAVAIPAAAQNSTPTEQLPATPEAEVDEGQTVVVTGSRIRQNETTSSSPLQIIDPVIAQRQGRFDTAEMVQSSPIASGSSQITSAVSSNGVSNGGPGAKTISLRGLGAERTLVLLNSRRAGPAGTRGAIASFDLNILPSSVIKSVEVLKDGASSIYGSDAVAGVVNLLTKTDTDGLELNGFNSIPQGGGGEVYNVSATWGKDFGRGHILIAGDYFKQRELERQDRSWLDCQEDYYFRRDGKTRADLVDPRNGKYFCDGAPWGHIWTYFASNLPEQPVTLLQYTYGDNLGRFLPGVGPATQPGDVITPPGWFPVAYPGSAAAYALTNSYHPFEQKASIIPETDRYTAYVDGAIEISDGIELYAEGIFNRRRTYTDYYSQFYNFGYTDLYAAGDPDNPFPGWSSFGGQGAFISPTGILDDYDNQITVDYYRAVAGVRGDIGGNWRYDVYGQYSRSHGEYQLQQILQDSINQQTARAYGAGCAGLFTAVTNKPCLQMNWVDPRVMAGDLNAAEKAYLLGTETGVTNYTQKFVEASISGNLFELPAGSLGIAVGLVYRRDEIDDQPGDITQAPNPDFGDPGEPEFIDNGFANNFSSGHTFGYSITKEAFGEISLPIFRDKWFARSLTLSGAARVTDVKAVRGSDGAEDSSNGNWTYKLAGNWQVTDWLRLRATYGTSYRAPALFEQFLASQQSDARQINVDPCVRWGEGVANGSISQRVATNCAADGIPADHTGGGIQVNVFTSGGLGALEPETSKAKTASVILTPRFSFLSGTDIAITVDYFDITVNGEIQLLDNFDIVNGCYSSDNFPNDPRCDLFVRGQDGNPNNIRSIFRQYINIDEQINRGIDLTVRLRQDLGSWGNLSFLGNTTWQIKDTINRVGEFDDLNGVIGDPKFTGDFSLTWDLGDTTVFWGTTVIGAMNSEEEFIELNGSLCNVSADGVALFGEYCVMARTPTTFYHNASVSQNVMDKFELTLGVSNVFNTAPPGVSGVTKLGNVSYAATQYDWIGRRFFVSAKAKF